eukprot:1398607-Amphidinium_carterae.1
MESSALAASNSEDARRKVKIRIGGYFPLAVFAHIALFVIGLGHFWGRGRFQGLPILTCFLT